MDENDCHNLIWRVNLCQVMNGEKAVESLNGDVVEGNRLTCNQSLRLNDAYLGWVEVHDLVTSSLVFGWGKELNRWNHLLQIEHQMNDVVTCSRCWLVLHSSRHLLLQLYLYGDFDV